MKMMIKDEPDSKKFIREFLGSKEFINGIKRYCLWLDNVHPNEYHQLKHIISRLRSVKEFRLKSTRQTTRDLANFPMNFGEIRQPKSEYLLIPGVSSENRKYIPIGFLNKDIIASDLARTIPDANLFLFGVLTSEMHMTWVKYVCGRLKSDYRYSNKYCLQQLPLAGKSNRETNKACRRKSTKSFRYKKRIS